MLSSLASAIAVFVTSIFYGSGFGVQYLIVAIPVFLLTAIISWLLFHYRPIKSYTFGNTCVEYILNSDGTALHNMHLEIRPNQQITDGPLIKGVFDDLPGWSEPIISHDSSLLGSCLDKNYPCRYLIWFTSPPIPRQNYTCSISREYTNTSEKPNPYISWTVGRKRQSITLFVAIHKDFLFNKDKVIFTTSLKGKSETSIPLAAEENDRHSKCSGKGGIQINSANYYIFKYKVQNPQNGYEYSIKWTWYV